MGHLQHVDVSKIFCNLQDLCEVTNIMKQATSMLLVNLGQYCVELHCGIVLGHYRL